MILPVEYIDRNNNVILQNHRLTRLAFAKHFGLAGQFFAPSLNKLFRSIGFFFIYSPYFQKNDFNNNRFSEPPIFLSNPTEKGHFSNKAGIAIADFLSKRIDNSILTVTYEAAMRYHNIPIRNSHPDLLAFNKNDLFAIEVKGSSKNTVDMTGAKTQSTSGGINVNFSVACASYNLYNNIKCKYYDPVDNNFKYDSNLLEGLSKSYYKGLSEYLNEDYFEINEFNFQNEKFHEIGLFNKYFRHLLGFSIHNEQLTNILDIYSPKLLLPEKIFDFAQNGISRDTLPFIMNPNDKESNIYIDNDRVGLKII